MMDGNQERELLKAYLRRESREFILIQERLGKELKLELNDETHLLAYNAIQHSSTIILYYANGRINQKEFEKFLKREIALTLKRKINLPKEQNKELLEARMAQIINHIFLLFLNFDTMKQLNDILLNAQVLINQRKLVPSNIFLNPYYGEIIKRSYSATNLRKKIDRIKTLFSPQKIIEKLGLAPSPPEILRIANLIEIIIEKRLREILIP